MPRLRLYQVGLLAGALLGPAPSHAQTQNDGGPAHARVEPHGQGVDTGDWPLLYTVDFGGEGSDLAPGSMSFDASKANRYVTWRRGMVRTVTRSRAIDPLTRDFIEGEDAVLVLASDSTSISVRCVLTLGDAEEARGPVRIIAGEEPIIADLATRAGEFVDVVFTAKPSRSRIQIHVLGEGCASFAVCAVSVFAPTAHKLFELPGVCDTSMAHTELASWVGPTAGQARAALRDYTEFLISQRPVEGCYAYSGNWYESAYALRTLLISAKLLHNMQYRTSALDCLDRFVGEQEKDGSWGSQYFGRKECPLARQTLRESDSRNLADVGTMALTLSMAIPETRGQRHASYLHAATTYAEAWVLPNQLPSGAFPNLKFQDRVHRHPYSVATGVQAANLAALYGVTGERRYLDAASRAASFLCRTIVDDGRVLFYPFDSDAATILEPDGLGNLFYVLEGLFWVHRYADHETKREIEQALARYFDSPWGIKSWPPPAEWLESDNLWEGSKRAGFLFLISQYAAMHKSPPEVKQWMQLDVSAMCNGRAANIGVLSDPAGPQGRHALFATGLAGLGMASVIEPASFFPIKVQRRP